jgi:hypothetical protein
VKARLGLIVCIVGLAPLVAQAQGRGGPAAPPTTAKAAAPADLTGQWVSVVTEDWRWRMITPAKGDYASVPLNPDGRKVADGWDLAADNAAGNQCRVYGAAAIMRMPERVRISWQDDATLKVETDAGQQTRLFHFVSQRPSNILPVLLASTPPMGDRTWQGESKAQWFKQNQSSGLGFGGPPPIGGTLRVVTRNAKAGYLRSNGVPVSENAVITEQFDRHDEANGDKWITVTTIVDDPQYLTDMFITSSSFKKETDQTKWSPSPCETVPPREPPVQVRRPAAPAAAPAAAAKK